MGLRKGRSRPIPASPGGQVVAGVRGSAPAHGSGFESVRERRPERAPLNQAERAFELAHKVRCAPGHFLTQSGAGPTGVVHSYPVLVLSRLRIFARRWCI